MSDVDAFVDGAEEKTVDSVFEVVGGLGIEFFYKILQLLPKILQDADNFIVVEHSLIQQESGFKNEFGDVSNA